jgi:hypothetical protein
MEKKLGARINRAAAKLRTLENSDCGIAKAYSQAGDEYVAYADGRSGQLFAFDGKYAYGDKVWGWGAVHSPAWTLDVTGTKDGLKIRKIYCLVPPTLCLASNWLTSTGRDLQRGACFENLCRLSSLHCRYLRSRSERANGIGGRFPRDLRHLVG